MEKKIVIVLLIVLLLVVAGIGYFMMGSDKTPATTPPATTPPATTPPATTPPATTPPATTPPATTPPATTVTKPSTNVTTTATNNPSTTTSSSTPSTATAINTSSTTQTSTLPQTTSTAGTASNTSSNTTSSGTTNTTNTGTTGQVLVVNPLNNQPLIHSIPKEPIILKIPEPVIITSSPLNEYPPTGSINWVNDPSNTIVGLRGITYNKKKYSAANNSYGNGEYVTWSNTMADNNTYAVQGLFDKNINWVYSSNAGWHTGWGDAYSNTIDSPTPAEVYIKLPNAILLKSYEIYPRGDGGTLAQTQGPIKWNLYGSNDNISYVLLNSQDNITGWTNLQSKTFDVSTNTKYNHYKWVFLRAGSANAQIVLNEIKLYGYE